MSFFFFFMFPTDDDVDISCLSFVWEALRLSQFKSDWPGGDRLHHYSPSAKTTLLSFLFLLRFMFCLFMKMTLFRFGEKEDDDGVSFIWNGRGKWGRWGREVLS